MPNEIIVRARLNGQSAENFWMIDFDRTGGGSSGGGGTREASGGGYNSANDEGLDANVSLVTSNSNLLPALEAAAKNVLSGILRLKAQLNDESPSNVITVHGKTMTVGDLQTDLANTKWVITDEVFSSVNGGVGAIEKVGTGFVAKLNFSYFDGDVANSGGRDYASPNYADNQGVVAIILHELGHVSDPGSVVDSQSFTYHLREGGTQGNYGNSAHWHNNENFAFDVAEGYANALGIDISQVSNYFGDYTDAYQLHIDRMEQGGGSGTGPAAAPFVDYPSTDGMLPVESITFA